MTVRIGDLRCMSCGHDPDSYNPVCGCAPCHNVFAGSSVPVPSSSPGDGGGGRSPVVPARHTTIPSAAGRDHLPYPQSSWGWWLAAAVSLMVVGFGALHGWHRTPLDTVMALVLPLSLILAGVFWHPKGGGR